MLVLRSSPHIPSFIPLLHRPPHSWTTLGRDPRLDPSHIHLNDPHERNLISRIHAKITRIPSSPTAPSLPPHPPASYQLVSVGANGVAINGQRRTSAVLKDGDVLTFAPQNDRGGEGGDLTYTFHATWDSAFPAGPPSTSTNGASSPPPRPPLYSSLTPPPSLPSDSPPPSSVPPSVSSQSRVFAYDAVLDNAPPILPDFSRYQPFLPPTSAPSASPAAPLYAALPPPPLTPQLTAPLPSPPISHSPLPDVSWNERFQAALDLPEVDEATALTKYVALSKLSSDFLSLARQYGRTIISEMGVGGEGGEDGEGGGGDGGMGGG